MPVIQVFACAAEDANDKLETMCREVSSTLGLGPSDVVATHIRVQATVLPDSGNASRPVIVVHGSAREPDQMASACERLRAVAASWGDDRPANGVWVTWQQPM